MRAGARRRALDASTAVGYRVVTESLRHKGRMAEQHREVVAVTQVFEGLGGVLDCKLRDGGLREHVFVDCFVQRRYGGESACELRKA